MTRPLAFAVLTATLIAACGARSTLEANGDATDASAGGATGGANAQGGNAATGGEGQGGEEVPFDVWKLRRHHLCALVVVAAAACFGERRWRVNSLRGRV